jgi:hypothetical protein
MSDDAYALVMILTTLAAAAALYFKIRVGLTQRKLIRELLPQRKAKGLWPPPNEARNRATEQLELADRLPLPGHVKDWTADNDTKVSSLVSEAQRHLDALRERLRSSP